MIDYYVFDNEELVITQVRIHPSEIESGGYWAGMLGDYTVNGLMKKLGQMES